MNIESRQIQNVLVLRPEITTIDASVSFHFKSRVIDWVTRGHNRIVLDLSGVEFMDSSGLGILLSILKTVGPDGRLVLARVVSSELKNLFRITRVDRIIAIHADVEDAVAQIAPDDG